MITIMLYILMSLVFILLMVMGYILFTIIREEMDIDIKKPIKNIWRFIKDLSYALWH